MVKGPSVVLPFVQDSGPAKAGLGPLKDKQFEQDAVVMLGDAPFGVVLGEIGLGFGPAATFGVFFHTRKD